MSISWRLMSDRFPLFAEWMRRCSLEIGIRLRRALVVLATSAAANHLARTSYGRALPLISIPRLRGLITSPRGAREFSSFAHWPAIGATFSVLQGSSYAAAFFFSYFCHIIIQQSFLGWKQLSERNFSAIC